MRNLLIIVLLFPLFLSGQIKDSNGNVISFNPNCYENTDLIQNLGTLNDTSWLDISGNGNHVDLVESNAFKFNGVDNYFSLPYKMEGGTPIKLEFNVNVIDYTSDIIEFVHCGTKYSSRRGLRIYASVDGFFVLRINSGSATSTYLTTAKLENGTNNIVSISWSGLGLTDVVITVNGVSSAKQINAGWDGLSYTNISFLGNPHFAFYSNIVVNAISYSFNGNPLSKLPFQLESPSITVYDVNNPNTLTNKHIIIGTVTSTNYVTNDKIHYNLRHGFSRKDKVICNNEVVGNPYEITYGTYIVGAIGLVKGYNTVNPISGLRDYKIYSENAPAGSSAYFFLKDMLTDNNIDGGKYNIKFKIRNNNINPITVNYIQSGGLATLIGYSIAHNETCQIDADVVPSLTYNAPVIYLRDNPIWDLQIDDIELTPLGRTPASLANPGYDAEGNTLTNPPVKNGHNGAETKLEQVNNLSAFDTDGFWYTGTTPNKVSYSDIQTNTGDYLFSKVDVNSKSRLLFYNQIQDTEYIFKCLNQEVKFLIK